MDLTKYLNFKVRKCTDNSGDYERNTYDILNVFDWGSSCITSDIDDPRIALLFAAAPEMLDALIKSMEFVYDLESDYAKKVVPIIERATGKIWGEILFILEKEREGQE